MISSLLNGGGSSVTLAHPVGDATGSGVPSCWRRGFSIHAPVGDATIWNQKVGRWVNFSIHSLTTESDSGSNVTLAGRSSWYNNRISRGTEVLGNFSLYKRQWVQRHAGALRGESDLPFGDYFVLGRGFSIHALRGESDFLFPCLCPPTIAFQSTHPVGDATRDRPPPRPCRCFSIHASRGGCDGWGP